MTRRFQFSLRALLVGAIVAGVAFAKVHQTRKAEIERAATPDMRKMEVERAIVMLRYWQKEEAMMKTERADCVPLRIKNEVRNEARAAEKRLKELRGY